jgi:hypothetical protein
MPYCTPLPAIGLLGNYFSLSQLSYYISDSMAFE